MSTPKELISRIKGYYRESQNAYLSWGKDEERNGVYAVHFGLDELGQEDHYNAVKRLTAKVVWMANVSDSDRVLDAGCGSGAVSFEIAETVPKANVVGVNISPDQLSSGQKYKEEYQIRRVSFSMQDYLCLGFAHQTFDKVIFCESFTHAYDKAKLLREVNRILRLGGKVIIFDALAVGPKSKEAQGWLNDVNEGWSVPDIPGIDEFVKSLSESGLEIAECEDLSTRVSASANFMGDHAERKIEEEGKKPVSRYKMRRACVATRELLKEGVIGYFAVSAFKTK